MCYLAFLTAVEGQRTCVLNSHHNPMMDDIKLMLNNFSLRRIYLLYFTLAVHIVQVLDTTPGLCLAIKTLAFILQSLDFVRESIGLLPSQ